MMNRLMVFVSALSAVGLCVSVSPADMVEKPDSIFYVDGLVADSLNEETPKDGKVFHADIKAMPLVIPQRHLISVESPRQFSIQARTPPQGKALERLRAAESYARQQDWSSALREVQAGLELDPSNMMLIRRAAALAALGRKFGVADDYFRRVIEAEPENVPFLAGRSGVLIRLLRLKEADEMAQRALAIDPQYLAARFNKACIQTARGEEVLGADWDLLTVADMAQVANWLDADGPDYLAALGDEGMNRLCDTVLGAGTRAYVKNILETLKKAEIATRLAQWKEAEGYLQTLKGFGTRAMGVQMEVGRCKFEEGDHDTAVALLKDLTVRYPATSSIIYNYAYLLVNVANYPEAAKQLIKATKLNPEDGQMKFALACCYAEQGMKDEAWTILSQLQATYPNQLREWAQGDAPYLRAIQQDPRYPQLIAAPAPQPKQPSSKDSPKS